MATKKKPAVAPSLFLVPVTVTRTLMLPIVAKNAGAAKKAAKEDHASIIDDVVGDQTLADCVIEAGAPAEVKNRKAIEKAKEKSGTTVTAITFVDDEDAQEKLKAIALERDPANANPPTVDSLDDFVALAFPAK